MTGPESLASVARRLAQGQTTSLELVDAALARIHDPQGEGAHSFIRIFAAQARAVAQGWDKMRRAGVPLPPLAGIPVSVKDLCDVAGSPTTAGSKALQDQPAANSDAAVVARLRAGGAVIIGTTNMTEFAMGGLGLNPHYGTPRNPYDRTTGRIPGGSSSGAAVSVADGMAVAAIGSDTAGSIRMPAAFCGIVGFKPTARRVPLAGTIPLAASLDSLGPLGASVSCCALMDAVLADDRPGLPEPMPISGLRFGVPTSLVLDDMTAEVARAFTRALTRLSEAGARIIEFPFVELREFPGLHAQGGFSVIEGYAWHRQLLAEKAALYDPIVARRFLRGAKAGAADYIWLLNTRLDLIRRCAPVTGAFDAILMPTVPMTPPPMADFAENEALWLATNRLMTRNPGIANILDRCALSLPCHRPGEPPVGLTVMGETMTDHRLLAIGRTVENCLKAAA